MANASGPTGAQALQRIQELAANPPNEAIRMTLGRLQQFQMSAGMLKRRKVELTEELEKTSLDFHQATGAIGALQQELLDLDALYQAETAQEA